MMLGEFRPNLCGPRVRGGYRKR